MVIVIYERERVQGLARGACCPLIGDERFARQLEVRSEELGVRSAGAAHKNKEAPRVKIIAMPESGI